MEFNFDEIVDRNGTNSLKWEVSGSELPMWVADMDFKTCPTVIEAIKKRTENGVFGYSVVPEQWYEAYSYWWRTRHNFEIKHEWLVFCTGVIPAISSIVRKLTTPAENVLIQTPVYNIFYNSILNNGRNVVENRLVYQNGSYTIDFADLEEKLLNPQTTMMLLCNPQNPAGIIWDKNTLGRIGELCKRYNVLVVADEIHCDLTEPNREYVPFASVSEVCAMNSVTCIAPTKAFNIAGLSTAAVMIPNENIRHKVERGLNTDECAEPNAFAVQAAVAAFTEGGQWLDELREYIAENKRLVAGFIPTEIPWLRLVKSEATYLLWLDCTALGASSEELQAYIKKSSGLWISAGNIYGGNGDGFLRMNVGCPRAVVLEGLRRLKSAVEAFVKYKRWDEECSG